jgi:hypothetical protein
MYIHSCDEKEYRRDVRKKNYIIKYVNLLNVDNFDTVSLRRFTMSLMFFRNTFCKDAFVTFFLKEFSEEEKKLLANIVFDVFVRSEKGEFCDFKEFLDLGIKLYKYVNYKHKINDKWEEMKEEFSDVV